MIRWILIGIGSAMVGGTYHMMDASMDIVGMGIGGVIVTIIGASMKDL
jgi:hypothetical protein